MNGLTARLSLDLLGLKAGQTLAVTGAPGAYGGYVVQLAKADGLTLSSMRPMPTGISSKNLAPISSCPVAKISLHASASNFPRASTASPMVRC